MLGIYTWSVLITGIFFTSFGIFAYLKNKKDLSNKLFGLLSLAFAIWCYAWFALLLVKSNQEMAIFWAKFLNLGAIFIPIFYLHWVLSVLNLHKRKKYLLILGYIIIFLFAINSFSPSYIKGVHSIFFFPFWPTAGPLYKWFLIFGYFGMVGYAFFKLIREIGKQEVEKRYQIGYIIVGSLLGFGGGATNFPLMYKLEMLQPIIGMIAVMASPFILGYAAVKYRLMNIKVVATELFGGVIALVLLINFLTSKTQEEWFIRGFVLILGLIFSVLFIRSVLKEVKMREELEKTNERLKELDKAKSEFVSIASHQLRTPITVVKGYSSMLLEGTFGAIPEKAKGALEKIFESSNRLVMMITDFLTLSRIERGKMEYNFQKVNFREMVNNIMDEFKAINIREKKGLDLSLEIAEEKDWTLILDSDKIRQVIYNIIENAMKYTAKGFIKVSSYKTPDKSRAVLKVQDSGIGINKESLGKIFQKFTQANERIEINIRGVGLGLYLAQEIIKAHQGRIWAESEGQGKGSTFYIELPC